MTVKQDKRARTRIEYTAHARIRFINKKSIKALVRDISLDSVYLYCRSELSYGERVTIEITLLGNQSELIIKAPAHVLRVEQKGVAFVFENTFEWWPVFTYFPLKRVEKAVMSVNLSLE